MVLMRAIWRRSVRACDGFGAVSADALKRMSKSSFLILARSNSSSELVLPRVSSVFIAVCWWRDPTGASGRREAAEELDLDGHLVSRALEGELGLVLRDPADLEDHAARLDHGGPELDVALAGAHARLGRLAGDRLVRERADPDFPLAVERADDRDAAGFELAAR